MECTTQALTTQKEKKDTEDSPPHLSLVYLSPSLLVRLFVRTGENYVGEKFWGISSLAF